MKAALLLPALLMFFPTTLASYPHNRVTLSTSLGDVVGERKSVGTGISMVEVFYGIPYAKPPVGERRFQAPLAAEPWGSSPLDGTVKPNACWQVEDEMFGKFQGVNMWNPNTNMSEDCLYLNIWRPNSIADSFTVGSGDAEDVATGSSHKTIMVWIFGGGFFAGSATLDVYDASQLAVREDVIVVTIAYRLGPLGFLYLGNADVPGNAAMMDQTMALKWIKDNAVNLGGHPDDITIFGESAGAASVGLHLFSPLSRNLFNNAIMQSTSPLADWAVSSQTMAKEKALDLATKVNCLNESQAVDEDALLACLRDVGAAELALQQWYIDDLGWFAVPFGPVVDGSFLTAQPTQLMRDGDIKLTNVTIGVNRDEGIYFGLYGFPALQNLSRNGQLSTSEFDNIMLEIAKNNETFKTELINEYSDDENNSYLNIVDAASGDGIFKCSVVDFAREYTKLGGSVYMYSFEENFSSNPWPDWMGVPHGYEIEVVFGIPLKPDSNNTLAEKNLTKSMINWWANFAKTGSPTGLTDDADWPLYTSQNQEYALINSEGLHSRNLLRQKQCQLWASNRASSIAHDVGPPANLVHNEDNQSSGSAGIEPSASSSAENSMKKFTAFTMICALQCVLLCINVLPANS
ncbi:carboxylic ester hydrolase [Elysia marginata]|uniref:Carboxylic ester hydrolase n=1 Tax=Elysia marginata TaxID=1093978 RepID=A0AAV4FBW9_9GAST|nr:carboxylic ester hydrolase [Elysia marginata]